MSCTLEENGNVPCNESPIKQEDRLLQLVLDDEGDVNKDEQCGCQLVCCKLRSKWYSCGLCQPLATAKWALGTLCIANMAQQTILNGLISVNISTLEKRFELRSTESGMIASCSDIAIVVAMIVISIFDENVHKPRWIGWGMLICGIGSLLFALPHFMAPEYTFVEEDLFNHCKNVTPPNCAQTSIRNYRYVFIVAVVIIGSSLCPLYTHGITYLDENVKKKNSAFYNSLYFALGGLGPALGFLCGGAALELYTYITVNPDDLTIDSDSYSWIGAWWIGFLVCGIIIIVNSVPLSMLPKYLPGTEKHRKNRNIEVQKNHLKEAESKSVDQGICRSASDIFQLLKNKPYVFVTLGMTTNCALIYGFNTFGTKYLESVFGLSPFHSSLLYGVTAIFANAGAMITSGIIIKNYNLSVKGILKFILAGGIVSAICSVGFVVHCGDVDIAGGNIPYPNATFNQSPTSSCNQECGCTTDRYQPVCAAGITYFSPCFAGCQNQINETDFANCTCLPANVSASVSTLSCDRNSCSMIIPFIFIVFSCFFSSLLTYTPVLQVTLRCVPFNKRVLAISLQEAVSRLLRVVPGRILSGMVLDLACVTWSTECGERGSCKAYRRWEVARNNTILLLTQTILCAIFYALVYLTYDPAGDSGERSEKGKRRGIVKEKGTVI